MSSDDKLNNPNINAKQSCSHGQANMGLGGVLAFNGHCPYCQPRCPCCGRPYGNYNYPYYPQYPCWQQFQTTC